MSLAPDLSRRFDLLRTILIAGLVVLHVPPAVDIPFVQPLTIGPALISKVFLGNVLFRGTVPVLGVISGFLLFRRTDWGYRALVWRKARTLLGPFLAWNIPVVLVLWTVATLGLSNYHFRADLRSVAGLMDAVFGLRGLPVNLPLGYLRDIFICVLFAPVIRLFLGKAPWVGFALLAAEAYVWPLTPLFLRPELPLFLYFGALLGTGRLSVRMFDRRWAWWVGLTLVSAVSATALLLRFAAHPEATAATRWVLHVFRWTAVPGFLAVSFALEPTRFGDHLVSASRWAFITFCSHAPILGAMWVVLHRVAAPYDSWGYVAFGIFGPVVAVASAVGAYEWLRHDAPTVLEVALGERTRPHMPRRRVAPLQMPEAVTQ